MLLQTEQYVTRSLTPTMASHRRSASSRGVFRIWKARRCAPLAPMPGSFLSCSISSVSGSGRDKFRSDCRLQTADCQVRLQIVDWHAPRGYQHGQRTLLIETSILQSAICLLQSKESRYLEASHHTAHGAPELFVHLPVGVVDGRDDQILQ